MINMDICEKTIGYVFKNKELLKECFTHSSYTNEHKKCKNNERLEFFGDSILGFIVTEYLFDKFINDDEGNMTNLKQKIVSKVPLSKSCVKFGFDQFLMLGEGEKKQLANTRESLCENLFEAIVAAIYIDGGLLEAKKFIKNKLLNGGVLNIESQHDYKGELQELLQKRKLGEIKYCLISKVGPEHMPSFEIGAQLNGETLAKGNGASKVKAEQQAAKKVIEILNSKGILR